MWNGHAQSSTPSRGLAERQGGNKWGEHVGGGPAHLATGKKGSDCRVRWGGVGLGDRWLRGQVAGGRCQAKEGGPQVLLRPSSMLQVVR